MINASKEFKEKLKAGAEIQNYADITLSNGTVLHLVPDDFWLGGCSIEDKTTDGKFGVGFVIGKTATLRLSNHDERFSDYDFYGSIINLYVAMQLDNGTIEKIRKGVFFTTVPETPGEIIEINAVDAMYKLDRDYSESTLTYPATLQQIITGACLDCGIPIGFRQFDNMSFTVPAKPENTKYRQVVSYACQIAGYNAHIDNDGYMRLVWYDTSLMDMTKYDGGDFRTWPHDTILDGGDFTFSTPTMIIDGGNFTDPVPENIYQIKNLNVSTDDIVITGVQVVGEEEDNAATAGESGYMIKVERNPFANGKEQEVAAYLGSRMIGLVFRAFSADILNNPLYEPFEVARVYDRKGNMYLTIINSISYTVGGYTQIACEAEDPVRNGSTYLSPAAQAVVEARRNAKKQITEYDKAVQNMNQLAGNALGFHQTVEGQPDGSRITYLHDKPTLAESTTIYKQTIDGFFISRDGGQSYTAGFDSSGNAIVNILYAIGIVADWIRSGRFECRKGNKLTFLADVDTGEVRIVADEFSLSSGQTIDSIAQDKATAAVNGQTQESVFNKLTNNGAAQGIYLDKGQLYVLFTYAKGGTLTLGGVNNANGKLSVRNAAGTEIGRWDKDGIMIDGGEIYSKTSGTTVSIYGGRMHLTYKNTDVGYIGTNAFVNNDNARGIVFDLNNTGYYMSWGYAESAGGNYIVKLLYASRTFDEYPADTVNFGCNVDFHDWAIKNAIINGLSVTGSVYIPNNTKCDIYSDMDFHNWAAKNISLNNIYAVNGYAPYSGSFQVVTSVNFNDYSYNYRTIKVNDGLITGI